MTRIVRSGGRRAPSGKKTVRKRANVVAVDDDSMVRLALTRLLRGAGFEVIGFDRPSEVLAADLPSDDVCLVLDIFMPEMSGIELWHELRNRGVEMPTILVTGERDDRITRWGEEIGAVAVLYKPIEEQELFDAITTALASRTN
jgi:FixJ family two-component response regulator